MKILAIDTSCDDTSAAVTEGRRVLSNVVSSQVRYHTKFGGVVPFLAQRLHKERIDSVIELALSRAQLTWDQIDAIAVTYGPGLAPALQVGIEKARELAVEQELPLYAVNHMAGHIASCYAGKVTPVYAALMVLASGNHSELVVARSFGDFQIVGQTLDDALGEAYDKVARMLGLGYPGGKLVATFAKEGNDHAYPLPTPMLHSGDFNLSYSGLKNAVRLLVNDLSQNRPLTRQQIADVSATFQRVAQESLCVKVERFLSSFPECQQVALAGGVAANAALRARLRSIARRHGVDLCVPVNQRLCGDNAAMIGVAAAMGIENGQKPVELSRLDRVPSLSLEDVSFGSH